MSNAEMQGLGILVARGLTRRSWSAGPDNNVFVGLKQRQGRGTHWGAALVWGGVALDAAASEPAGSAAAAAAGCARGV